MEDLKKFESLIEDFLKKIKSNDYYKKSQSLKPIKKFNSLKNYQKIAAIIFITYISGCVNGKNSIKNYTITNNRDNSAIQKAQQKLNSNKVSSNKISSNNQTQQPKPERESSALRAMREANEQAAADRARDEETAKRREQLWKENEERKIAAVSKKEISEVTFDDKVFQFKGGRQENRLGEKYKYDPALQPKTNIGFKFLRAYKCEDTITENNGTVWTLCNRRNEAGKIIGQFVVSNRGPRSNNLGRITITKSLAFLITPSCDGKSKISYVREMNLWDSLGNEGQAGEFKDWAFYDVMNAHKVKAGQALYHLGDLTNQLCGRPITNNYEVVEYKMQPGNWKTSWQASIWAHSCSPYEYGCEGSTVKSGRFWYVDPSYKGPFQ